MRRADPLPPLPSLAPAEIVRVGHESPEWADAALVGAAVRVVPAASPRGDWRWACCLAAVAARLRPTDPPAAFAEAFLAGTAAIAGVAPDDLAQAWSRSPPTARGRVEATVAAWLLHQRRLRAPQPAAEPEPSAIRSLGLGPDGLVRAIAALSEAVEDGRRLARAALEAAEAARRRR